MGTSFLKIRRKSSGLRTKINDENSFTAVVFIPQNKHPRTWITLTKLKFHPPSHFKTRRDCAGGGGWGLSPHPTIQPPPTPPPSHTRLANVVHRVLFSLPTSTNCKPDDELLKKKHDICRTCSAVPEKGCSVFMLNKSWDKCRMVQK